MEAFSFKGRIGRLEYFIVFILCIFFLSAINFDTRNGFITGDAASIIFLFEIVLYWFLFASGAKRCHDIGVSGWFQIIPFYFLWMIFKKGQPFENNYGYPTK